MARIDRQSAFSGTKEVAAPLRFDETRLGDYLAAKVAGFRGPLAVRQFKGGQSNPTYFLETPARCFVLRRKPPGKLLPSAHAVDREYRVIAALHRQGFPVPEPLAYCDDPDVVGTAFFVMGFVEGRIFWEPHLPASHPTERAAIYDAANATIARLHSFDPAAIGLADFGRGENYVARQVERWSKQYRTSQTDDIADMERLIEWLPRNLPPAGPVRLVLADFTYHLMKWHMPETDTGASTGSLLGHDLAALGIPAMSDYVDAYVARTGLDPRPYLAVYLAYNFFRIAAIYQGIVGRVRDGTATSEHAPAKAAMVRPLAATAWAFACEAR
jgi:aminoglycoside phosphotransferase (APT) family kinase protein